MHVFFRVPVPHCMSTILYGRHIQELFNPTVFHSALGIFFLCIPKVLLIVHRNETYRKFFPGCPQKWRALLVYTYIKVKFSVFSKQKNKATIPTSEVLMWWGGAGGEPYYFGH